MLPDLVSKTDEAEPEPETKVVPETVELPPKFTVKVLLPEGFKVRLPLALKAVPTL